MLKKQTVWLLTMLSLMIVLSVYYMTSKPEDFAYLDSGKKDDTEETSSNTTDEKAGVDVQPGGNELFASLRLEVQDKRSMKLDRLKDIVANGNASAEEKKQAYDEMDVIEATTAKENILEDSIAASAEYQDVLVRYDEDVVHVHVQVDEISKKEVLNIMQMVRDEFGEVTVNVVHEPITES
ncbi:SpoIIIAH-like family protein [Ornithinibacillus bavariensis]|uniref:Stage III sporulation protein AH n=1 Tax=Ornithinibacillus bavariensis TaxID=545502 RepID=A0A920C772_9BACI|nr:SpoIIIAH-like family protein [Ornithinibacillus bavariensis]GIO28555.1 stage III sporulation protein AH [Ornithinibacillus bavariensis]HAM80273.1 stage III sporulation protein AH [Ornithinibacillus sp.]